MTNDTSGKESICQFRILKSHGFDPWVGKIPWSRKRQLAPVFRSGRFPGKMSLEGYRGDSPWVLKELDMTEGVHTHTADLHCCI